MSETAATEFQKNVPGKEDVSKWADQMIRAWISRINMLGITDTGSLIRSFTYRLVWEARGEDKIGYLAKIQFLFNFYGKFVDYGLGRGVDWKDRFCGGKSEDGMRRKRQEWIRAPWEENVKSFSKIIAAATAAASQAILCEKYIDGVEVRTK